MCQDDSQKQKILIVDDSEINRSILADILSEEYDTIEAADGVEAIETLERHTADFSVVLLDLVMPRKNGFEVLNEMNARGWIDKVPVIIISAESDPKQIEKAYDLGVTDFISRPFDARIVHRRVVNTVLLYSEQKKMMNLVIGQINEKERLNGIIADIMSHIVEFRNGESGQHIMHIRVFTEVILTYLQRMTGRYELKKQDISQISLASALHDIGKLAIDEKLLNKPGKLTNEEFEVMKTHAAAGAQMLEKLPDCQETQLVRTAYEICRWHHERYDGQGYPDGLRGDEIPISAQAVGLADVYDALISERSYKKAFSHETAVRMILNGECGEFNPLLTECFKQAEGILNTEFIRLKSDKRSITRNGLAREFLNGENAFASERSLYLVDLERMEYGFFSAITDDIQFKYTASTDTLSLSPWSAEKLGVDEMLTDPLRHESIIKILGETACGDIKNEILNSQSEHRVFRYECPFLINNKRCWYRITAQVKRKNGEISAVVGKAVDINDSHMQIDALEKRASYDDKTELLNHAGAKAQIIKRLEMTPDGIFSLSVFDVDCFKAVNDTYGHIFGDGILKGVAKKARQGVRGNDIVARIGGDEFLIFMEYKNEAETEGVINRIFNSLNGEYENVNISVSMGTATSLTAGNKYKALLLAADQALYCAKRAGRCKCLFYDDTMKDTLSASSDENKEDTQQLQPVHRTDAPCDG